ncbi:MAG: hypothetical protein HYY26_03650 [Acidobacteria bacterium]|nr:hypothetical protein [Acidobacteriota bacterium]
MLAERKIALKLTERAREWLFREGFDPAYGAWPLKRALQRLIQDPLAQKMLKGEVLPGDTVTVDADPKTSALRFDRSHAEALA